MQIFQGQNHLTGVEKRLGLVELVFVLQEVEQLPPLAILENKEKLSFVLESVMQLYDERMLESGQDVSFGNGVGDLFPLG